MPWDQALDIVMQARGLDMRRNGNVLWIAPKDELLTKERLELEQRVLLEVVEDREMGGHLGPAEFLAARHMEDLAAEAAVAQQFEQVAGIKADAGAVFYRELRRGLGTGDRRAVCAMLAYPMTHPAGDLADAASCEARYDALHRSLKRDNAECLLRALAPFMGRASGGHARAA